MKSWAIVAITVIIGVIFFIGIIQESFAVSSNLFVSAENSRFDNYVSGPQVIEVVIIDSNIDETNEVKGEPEVLVNGKILRMVQAVDGNWYGYFADRRMAQIADSTSTPDSQVGLDFGVFCSPTTAVNSLMGGGSLALDFSDSNGVAIPMTGEGSEGSPTGATITASCGNGTAIATSPHLNVVREAKEVNTNVPSGDDGQINVNPAFWPFVQLYALNPTGNIVVQYNQGGAAQTTTLTFDEVDLFADLRLDKSNYTNGDSVNVKITDSWLNIDPTDEDSWTFGTSGIGGGITVTTNYQVFDENGNSVGDFLSNAGPLNTLTSTLGDLMCADNCRLLINTDANGQGIALTLQDNDNSEIRSTNPQEDGNPQNPFSWETIFGNISGDFPVTLTEQAKNSGEFTTFDEFNVSNLVITDKAVTGSAAEIDYNKTPLTILVINDKNSPPDCSTSFPSVDTISPANKKLVDVSINGVTDPEGDEFTITIARITQDETTDGLKGNDLFPDGFGVGTDTAQVRAQKDSQGNGRVYEIAFTVNDGNGGICSDSVNVVVPKNKKTDPVDDGQNFDSTLE